MIGKLLVKGGVSGILFIISKAQSSDCVFFIWSEMLIFIKNYVLYIH